MEGTSTAAPSFVLRNKHLVETAIDLAGGTLGGIVTVYVGQPLDTVKVKMQTFPSAYRNSLHCFIKTFKDLGLAKGLYAGTVPSLAANVAENAILFVAYGICQKAICFTLRKESTQNLNAFQNALAGSCASFFSSLALCPTELVKCRLQVIKELQLDGKLTGPLARMNHVGSSVLVRHIIKQEGVRGLFHGLNATFAREMPGYFFFFGGYETCRTLLTPAGKTKDDLSAVRLLVCGGMGGVAYWVSIFPTDVMKSRIQVNTQVTEAKKISYFSLMLKIIKEEGLLALYKGLGPTVVRTFCATAALFYSYETSKQFLTELAYGSNTSNYRAS